MIAKSHRRFITLYLFCVTIQLLCAINTLYAQPFNRQKIGQVFNNPETAESYDQQIFAERTDLREKVYPRKTTFIKSVFKQAVDFSTDSFRKDVSFAAATFADTTMIDEVFFARNATFVTTHFKGYTTFLWTNFNGCADFQLDSFESNTSFHGSLFDSSVFFNRCRFQSADFSEVRFRNGNVNFPDAIYNGDVTFAKSSINGISFDNACMKKKADFSYVNFADVAGFRFVTFRDTALFRFDTFRNDVLMYGASAKVLLFDSTEIYKGLYLDQSNLGDYLSLSHVILTDSSSIHFKNCILPDTLNFAYLDKIYKEIDLTAAAFTDSTRAGEDVIHYIYLHKCDIAKLHLDYEHFRLLLTDPDTRMPLKADDAVPIYEALLKNFKDHGQTKSYQRLDIEFNDYLWKQSKYFSWYRVVPHYWNFYGYRKGLIFLWTLAFLLFFSCINFFMLDYLSGQVYVIEGYEQKKGGALSKFFSSVIYTSMIFFFLKLDVKNIKRKDFSALYILMVYLSGIVCLAYMANFVIQK